MFPKHHSASHVTAGYESDKRRRGWERKSFLQKAGTIAKKSRWVFATLMLASIIVVPRVLNRANYPLHLAAELHTLCKEVRTSSAEQRISLLTVRESDTYYSKIVSQGINNAQKENLDIELRLDVTRHPNWVGFDKEFFVTAERIDNSAKQ